MSIKYRGDIDGLRALAVVSVVIFHAFPDVMPGGFVGVDVFFVISGYLISSIIMKEADRGEFSIRKFYIRRARRVFPALALVLLSCMVFGWFVLLPADYLALGENAVGAAFFVANVMYWRDAGYFDVSSIAKPLLHLWSLGIEEQFYIVWPLLIAGLVRYKAVSFLVLISIIVSSFLWSSYSVTVDPTAAFYSPLSRAWELAAGGLVAWFLSNSDKRLPVRVADALEITGLLLIAYALTSLSEAQPFPGQNALAPVVGASLIIAGRGIGMMSRMVLAQKPFVALGLISYPLYLWHWPLISFANIVLDEPPSPHVSFLLVLASIVLAAGTYVVLERPIRERRVWTKNAPLFGSASLVATAAFGLAVFLSSGAPTRYPVEIQQVLQYGAYEPAPIGRHPMCWVFPDVQVSDFPPECRFDGSDKRRVMIWGDSHAAMLYSGINARMGSEVNIAQFTRISCPPLLDFPGYCGQANQDMLDQIKQDQPDVLVMFGAWANYGGYQSDSFDQAAAFRKTLNEVMQLKIEKVLVVGPAPFWTPFLPAQVYKSWARDFPLRRIPERLKEGDTDLVRSWDAGMRSATLVAGASYFSLRDMLCNTEGCLTHTTAAEHELIIFDNSHLTREGAEMISKRLEQEGLL